MDRQTSRWQFSGWVFTSVAGTLLHFVYDWSGEAPFAGVISAVNESVWEHMKLLFIPMLLFALMEAAVFGARYPGFWRVKLRGILTGLTLIPTLYYTYSGALGFRSVWVDISIFYLSAAGAYITESRKFREAKAPSPFEIAAAAAVCLIAFLFLLFTYAPPLLPLFMDPLTFTYGIT